MKIGEKMTEIINSNISYFIIGLAVGLVGGWIVWRIID